MIFKQTLTAVALCTGLAIGSVASAQEAPQQVLFTNVHIFDGISDQNYYEKWNNL